MEEQDKIRLEYLKSKTKLSVKERCEVIIIEQELAKLTDSIVIDRDNYTGIENYFDVVEVSANKIYNTARRSGAKAIQVELKEELKQAGYIALMEAWRKFDDKSAASFRTYSYYRVRGSMLDFLRSSDTCSRSVRAALKQITHDTNNNTFTSDTLTQDEVNTAVRRSTVVSQFDLVDGNHGDNDNNNAVDFADTNDNSYKNFEINETLKSMLKTCPLTDRERIIIDEHYFNDKNLFEIGKVLDLTESRVSQLHKSCLEKLSKYV